MAKRQCFTIKNDDAELIRMNEASRRNGKPLKFSAQEFAHDVLSVLPIELLDDPEFRDIVREEKVDLGAYRIVEFDWKD